MSTKLDADQQRAVAARTNVVVSAGAGSGKTRVLTERYVDLIRSGVAVREILALTFTRKAAAEMFQRIYERLHEIAAEDAQVQAALDHFDEAEISTLDSFCAAIVRDATASLGLPPDIVTDEQALTRETRSLALAHLMEHETEPIIAHYVRQYGMAATVENLFLALAQHVLRLSRPIEFDGLADRQLAWLESQQEAREAEIDRCCTAIRELSLSAPSSCAARDQVVAASDDPHALYTVLTTMKRTLGRGESDLVLKAYLNELLTKKSGGTPQGIVADWFAAAATQSRQDDLRAFYRVLASFQDRVLSHRQQTGLLSYQEVMELAVQVLTRDPELRSLYKRRFHSIMIDEFQDNNDTQRQLLFLLGETYDRTETSVPRADELRPGALFFVGDQKQSIYRFRGADVRVFRTLARDIERAPGAGSGQIRLVTNYRSEPFLIAFFNELFTRVFVGGALHEAEFEPLGMREADPQATPRVVLARVMERDDAAEKTSGETPADTATAGESEAAWIAQQIMTLVSGPSGYHYRDIAILFRSTSNQHTLERLLRRTGIPYQVQAVRSLFLEAPASDLYALLQLALVPEDRSALAAYLRSPLVMASDTTVVRVLAAMASLEEIDLSTWSDEELPPAERRKLERGRELLASVAQRIDRVPLDEIIRSIRDDAGYRYAILHRASDHSYLEHVDYLIALARGYADRPAIEFVEMMRASLGTAEKRDEFDPPAHQNAVQLMTIHKSKGLEFPVVFVSGLDSQPRTHHELFHEDPELELTVRLPSTEPGERPVDVFVRHAAEVEAEQETAEMRRLLYVACTRAQQQLYLSIGGNGASKDRTLFRLIADAVGYDVEAHSVSAPFDTMVECERIAPLAVDSLIGTPLPRGADRRSDEIAQLHTAVPVRRWTEVPSEITPTTVNLLLREFDHSAQGVGSTAPAAPAPPSGGNSGEQGELFADVDDADGEYAAALGTLAHLAIEYRIRGVVTHEWWHAREGVAYDAAVRALGGASPAEIESLLGQAWQLADTFLASPIWQQRGEAIVHTELPFLYHRKGIDVYTNGTMDLVLEYPDHVHVIDFKSDQDVVSAHYDGQMTVYREAATALFQRPAQVTIFGLRTGSLYDAGYRPDEVLTVIERWRDAARRDGSAP